MTFESNLVELTNDDIKNILGRSWILNNILVQYDKDNGEVYLNIEKSTIERNIIGIGEFKGALSRTNLPVNIKFAVNYKDDFGLTPIEYDDNILGRLIETHYIKNIIQLKFETLVKGKELLSNVGISDETRRKPLFWASLF